MPREDYECACDAGYYGAACERMHHRVVDAEVGPAFAGSGPGSSTVEPAGFSIAAPGFIQQNGPEEEEEDPLASREVR